MSSVASTPKRYTLKKAERLHLKRDVDALFASGEAFIAYPLRVVWQAIPATEERDPHSAILVVVAKKYFRRANKRNRIKRLIRESYRLRKHELLDTVHTQQLQLHLALLSVCKELPTQAEVDRGMEKALRLIQKKLQPAPDSSHD